MPGASTEPQCIPKPAVKREQMPLLVSTVLDPEETVGDIQVDRETLLLSSRESSHGDLQNFLKASGLLESSEVLSTRKHEKELKIS